MEENRWKEKALEAKEITLLVKDQFGNDFKLEILQNGFYGTNFIEYMERFLNVFFSSMGYSGFDKETVMLESVTFDEYEYLIGCLDHFRSGEDKDE